MESRPDALDCDLRAAMVITDALVLPRDVEVVRVAELERSSLAGIDVGESDWAVTRPRTRTPTRLVSADLAELLLLFRDGRRIVDAVIEYATARGAEPALVLEQSWPALKPFLASRLLVPSDSPAVDPIEQSLEVGAHVGGYELRACVQVLEDTELYQARAPEGQVVAVKLARPGAGARTLRDLEHEASVLRRLDGSPSPRLLATGELEARSYLVTEWCGGIPITVVAQESREHGGASSVAPLRELCLELLDAYATLHANGVVHGDVHPGNVLVDAQGAVRILDFGMARVVAAGEGTTGRVARGGVPEFHDPQLALAGLHGTSAPPATLACDEYALGALVYLLLCGRSYVDFSPERETMLRQIVEEQPAAFPHDVRTHWPGAEAVVGRALDKSPDARHGSAAAFAAALRAVEAPRRPRPTVALGAEADGLVDLTLLSLEPDAALFRDGIQEGPTGSVTFGAAGIAYALYRFACIRDDPALLADADLWISKALQQREISTAYYAEHMDLDEQAVGAVSPYHTESGLHAVQAIVAFARGDSVSVCQALERFVELSGRPNPFRDLTLGQSGTLLVAAELLTTTAATPALTGQEEARLEALRALGAGVMDDVWEWARSQPAIGAGGELTYLGAAHGWAGLCYAALVWCRVTGAQPPDGLEARLDELAELAEPYGRGARWPIRTLAGHAGQSAEFMPSWCNGAPGLVALWTEADRRYDDPHHARLAELAAWNAWEERAHGPGICCGDAGRSYALASFYRHSGEGVWLDRARRTCARAIRAGRQQPELRHSLYKGELGIALLAADLDAPAQSHQPFFEVPLASAQPARAPSTTSVSPRPMIAP